MRTLLTLLSFSLSVIYSYSHSKTIKNLNVNDGLSSNYVLDISEDKQGCIWLVTEYELNKFDGKKFTVFKREIPNRNSSEYNTLLSVPEENSLWIGTQKSGINIFNISEKSFKTLDMSNGLITNDIIKLTRATDGGIWITHYNLGIDYYDINIKKVSKSYNTSNIENFKGRLWTSCDDGKGNLYIGHKDNGMSIINLKDMSCRNYTHDPNNKNSIPDNEVKTIFIDKAERVWVGTNNGLALFNPNTEDFITFKYIPQNPNSLLSNKISNITQTKDGKIWICSSMGGVSVLDMQENSFTDIKDVKFHNYTASQENGISSPNAQAVIEDKYGNVWIANYRGGVDFISYGEEKFKTLPYYFKDKDSYRYKQVWCIYANNNDDIILGGEDEIVIFKDNRIVKNIEINQADVLRNTHINTMHKMKNGNILLGTYMSGVLLYNVTTSTYSNISKEHKNIDVRCFFEEKDGKILIGSTSGMFNYTNNNVKRNDTINNQISNYYIIGITRDKEGKLWVGTSGEGLYIFNSRNKLIGNITTKNGLPSDNISTIFKDKNNSLWIGSKNGLVYIADTDKPEKIVIYTQKEGLEDGFIRGITEGYDGNIWFSTNAGISSLNKGSGKIRNYNFKDGVPRGDFMNTSVCIDNTGNLYFGSQNGVCFFNPMSIKNDDVISPIEFTNCLAFLESPSPDIKGKIIPIDNNKISLKYNENNFRINFNITNYTQSSQAEYIYMMEGIKDAWYNTEGDNQVTFRNLPYGNYKFKVNARLRNQSWNENNIATLEIAINPPLWLTWYAKLLYTIVICIIVIYIIRVYKHKLELESKLKLEHNLYENEQKLNTERLRFYTNIAHELRTPLTLIIGPLEDLLSDKTLSVKHSNKISIIHDSANRLLSLINQILEFRKTETQNRKLTVINGNIAKLVQEVGFNFKELNQNNNIQIDIKIDIENKIIFFDPDMITTIINNLMSNAIKYTPQGKITLTLNETENNGLKYTQISVEDTGVGISEEALPHIFERYYQAKEKHQASGTGIGLALVKSLTDLHEGEIYVESKVNVGSKFVFSILSENTYPNAIHKENFKKNKEVEDKNLNSPNEDDDSKPILLIVEDNNEIREYIKCSFEDLYEVLTASNGKEGWEIAKNRIPSIIITDVMMPIMDGITLCKKVKEDMRTSHIPVIMLTAKDSIQDKEDGYAAGADSFLTKPFSARLLHKRIENLLDARKKLAGMVATRTVSSIGSNTQEDLNDLANCSQILNKLDKEFLDKVNSIIEENLSLEKMDVAFIADKMCMSHSTLYRKIKGLTDMSVNEFVKKIKMKKSIELLANGEYNLSEVADMTGFSSVAYFRQCFKDEYGMAPTEYLKQQK